MQLTAQALSPVKHIKVTNAIEYVRRCTPLSYITGELAPIFLQSSKWSQENGGFWSLLMPSPWQLVHYSHANYHWPTAILMISQTLSPPENKHKFYFRFCLFFKNKFAVQQMGQFFLVYGCCRRKTRENASSHCVIKFISTKMPKYWILDGNLLYFI